MRLIWLHPRRVVEALALEEAILRLRLENGLPDTLCFWRGRKCVVMGYNPNRDRVDLELCRELGIPICRRHSGGGAIYQDSGNLNYSLIADQDGFGLPRDVQRARWVIDSLVAEAISSLGLRANPMKGGGIGIGGKKVSGSAQFVLWGYLLHHGVIAVSTDLELMHKLFPNGGEVTNLEQELGRQIDIKMLARSIAERLARGLGAELEVGSLTQAEASLAHDLLREKYLSEEWNNRRCA